MPAHQLRRFARPDFLRSIEPTKLARLLLPYQGYFRDRGVSLEIGRDFDDPSALLRLFVHPDDEMPSALLQTVCAIDELSAPEVMDELLAEGLIPPDDTASPADAVVNLWLERPDLAARKHRERQLSRPRSYIVCRPVGRKAQWDEQPPADACARLEAALSWLFQSRNRGRYVEVQVFPKPDEVFFLIRHGDPLRREEAVAEDRRDLLCFRPARHDVVAYERRKRRLRVHADTLAQARAYVRAFGKHLFGNEAHFIEMPHYSLQPLRELRSVALACADVEGIELVKLVELELLLGGAYAESVVHRATDLMEAFAESADGFPAHGWLAGGKFAVKFADTRTPRKVVIRPPNTAKYQRDGDSHLVEQWLANRGFLLGDDPWVLARA